MENELQKESLDSGNNSGLKLNQKAVDYLTETRKWSAFLAIIGFIFTGLMLISVIKSLIATTLLPFPLDMLTGPMITIFSLVILCIYFFPAYFIYQFSVYSKRAILDRDTEDLDKAMKFLNFYFRFIGILAIVVLSMMVIVILFAGLAAAFFTS